MNFSFSQTAATDGDVPINLFCDFPRSCAFSD